MRVPESIRKSVAFLGYRNAAGEFNFAGTGFFLGRGVDDLNISFRYLVTARHVIDGIRDKGLDLVYVRLNRADGTSEWFSTNAAKWHGHGDGKAIDVAFMQLPGSFPWSELDHQWFPMKGIATPEVIEREKIGVGEELFTVGLFHRHIGKLKNIPVVRVGNIAAMPEEPVPTRVGDIEAYLTESRSIGGLSGSPVFVHLGALRLINGEISKSANDHGTFFLLGLVFGHFDSGVSDADDLVVDATIGDKRINMGIGVVIPAMKITETIQRSVGDSEKQIEADVRRSRMPTADALNEPEPFTRADFETALKKVSRKIERKP